MYFFIYVIFIKFSFTFSIKASNSSIESPRFKCFAISLPNNLGDFKNGMNDMAQGFETKEGNPQSIEDLFAGDGYKVLKSFNKNGATYYAVARKTGAFGGFFGPEGNDMAEELNIYLDGNGTATYVGYKVGKIPGAILCTLGIVIPSLVIILKLKVQNYLRLSFNEIYKIH